MTITSSRTLRRRLSVGLAVAAFFVALPASAQQRGEAPGYPRDGHALYPLEIEPHFTFGAENVYGASGFGAGLRLSIPVIAGYVGRLPDNLAISFGGDILHYDNCYYGGYCSANYLMLPIAAQWNLFVARRVSLFGEAGAFVYKGWFDGCRSGDGPGCDAPSDFGVLPTIAIGARFHIADNASFTARIGYPTMTLGVSFL
jgi:hypothetical protein